MASPAAVMPSVSKMLVTWRSIARSDRNIDLVDTLPRTTTGRVQKYLLRERYWPDRDRQVA